MGRYSSDSDSERRSNKTLKKKSRRRSSSTDSSDSRRRRTVKKSHKRVRSKDRHSKSSRRSRSSSFSSKSRSYRSDSKDRPKYRRSKSRDRYRSRRSRSKSYIREYTNSNSKRRSSSSSSDSADSKSKIIAKPKPSIIAEKFSNLTTQPTVPLKVKETLDETQDCVIIDSKTLEHINDDSFAPKQFTSTNKFTKSSDNILIDLNKQTIKIPEVNQELEPDSIFHHCLFQSHEARMEKWIRELSSYRQKALQQGWKNE